MSRYSLGGKGILVNVDVAPPIAGTANVTLIVPVGEIWVPLTVRATVTTDSNNATRKLFMGFLVNVVPTYNEPQDFSQSQSSTTIYNWGRGVVDGVVTQPQSNSQVVAPIPETQLPGEAVWLLTIDNVQVGDEYDDVRFTYLKFHGL